MIPFLDYNAEKNCMVVYKDAVYSKELPCLTVLHLTTKFNDFIYRKNSEPKLKLAPRHNKTKQLFA